MNYKVGDKLFLSGYGVDYHALILRIENSEYTYTLWRNGIIKREEYTFPISMLDREYWEKIEFFPWESPLHGTADFKLTKDIPKKCTCTHSFLEKGCTCGGK